MRTIATVKYSPKATDLYEVDTPFVIDAVRLAEEVDKAAHKHEFTRKAFGGWSSIPLRSIGGIVGAIASAASGENASSDPSIFQDTPVMQPYIKSIVDQVGGPDKVLKVRLMKLEPHRSIGEHRDVFKGDGTVARFHIPIITHPKVIFKVNGKPYHMKQSKLYCVDVSERHSVINSSRNVDRIHLVFDIVVTPELRAKLELAIARNR
jgi:hypothetical protein